MRVGAVLFDARGTAEAVRLNSRLFLVLENILETASASARGMVTTKPQRITVPLLERLGADDAA